MLKRKSSIKAPSAATGKTIASPPTSVETILKDDEAHITFSLRYVQKGFCFEDCDDQEKLDFAKTIFKRKDLSWREIRSAPRHGLGSEKIAKKSIRPPIPENKIPLGTTDFIALRFSSKKPMVGYRLGHTFYILWFDPKFELYDHG